MKITIWALLIALMLFEFILADNRIIMYLRHAPSSVLQETENELSKNALIKKITKIGQASPADVSKKNIKYAIQSLLRPHLSGFLAVYGGYIDFSNQDGLISFPLRHSTPKLYVAITPYIKLVHIKGNTFSHREFIENEINQVDLYSFEIKTDEKKISFWDVQKVPLPNDKKVSPLTVVILTHPKNILIQEGKFIAMQNIQLVLPDNIFVLDRSSNEHAVLQMLDAHSFFEPIIVDKKNTTDLSAQSMITNL